jgi:Oligopeptide/dipeptide transporter, C-terminal region
MAPIATTCQCGNPTRSAQRRPVPRETPTARRFVESDGAEDLLRNPQSAYTKKLLDAVPRLSDHTNLEAPA